MTGRLLYDPTVAAGVALQAVQQDPRVTQLVMDLSQSIQAAADDTGENMPALLVLNKVCTDSICLCMHHALVLSMQDCHHNATYPAGSSETDMPCVLLTYSSIQYMHSFSMAQICTALSSFLYAVLSRHSAYSNNVLQHWLYILCATAIVSHVFKVYLCALRCVTLACFGCQHGCHPERCMPPGSLMTHDS